MMTALAVAMIAYGALVCIARVVEQALQAPVPKWQATVGVMFGITMIAAGAHLLR